MGASFLEQFSNNENQDLVLKDQFALVGGQYFLRSIHKKQLNKDHKEQSIAAIYCLNTRAKNQYYFSNLQIFDGLENGHVPERVTLYHQSFPFQAQHFTAHQLLSKRTYGTCERSQQDLGSNPDTDFFFMWEEKS